MSEEAAVSASAEPPPEWAIIEIYGHRRHAGRLRDYERFGAKMLQIDVPLVTADENPADPENPTYSITGWTSHVYGGGAIFSMTPTDEATVVRFNRPQRTYTYRLAAPAADDDERPF